MSLKGSPVVIRANLRSVYVLWLQNKEANHAR
jgi:hypothetical protein